MERVRDRNKQAETKRETNPNRKAKTQYLEDNLIVTKNPKGRAFVCQQYNIEAENKQAHNFMITAHKKKRKKETTL